MSAAPDTAPARPGLARRAWLWIINRPYLLLSITSLTWAGNLVLGRHVVGHIPPFTFAFVRWGGAVPLILPFAWPYLKRDWPQIRAALPLLALLAATGYAGNNALAYSGLHYTQALNGLLIQSAGPLFVALWSLVLFGVRLTPAQGAGIVISMAGVLTILLHGDFRALLGLELNIGDLMLAGALLVFGIYAALVPKRPPIHPISFFTCTVAGGALFLSPLALGEMARGQFPVADWETVFSLSFAVLFPGILGYLCLNRGIALIGPNRSAPFIHLTPVFGSVMAILFLGERLALFHVIGYALVLAGITIAARKPAQIAV
jgi:drug/metabolite transporter (DMT)-like permease